MFSWSTLFLQSSFLSLFAKHALRFRSLCAWFWLDFDDLDVNAVMEIMELEREWDKEVRFFSSGMKQRLKLALSILSQSGFILLDEPSTNLDQASTQWFLNLLEKTAASSTHP